jgi:hypothetical protein
LPYHDGCLPSYKFLVHLFAALRSGKDESRFSSLCQNLKIPSLTNFLTDKTSTFKYKCNKIVKQHYLELWTKQAHSLKEGKLRKKR